MGSFSATVDSMAIYMPQPQDSTHLPKSPGTALRRYGRKTPNRYIAPPRFRPSGIPDRKVAGAPGGRANRQPPVGRRTVAAAPAARPAAFHSPRHRVDVGAV